MQWAVTDRSLIVNGARLRVTTETSGEGRDRLRPSVVGVHGGPGLDGAYLRFLLRGVAAFADVVVPDQRGHGVSDLGLPSDWNLDTWADDLAGLIDALGVRTPVVLGTSFGGFVVQRYLARHPDQPAGAVLISTAPRAASRSETVERFRELGGDEAADAMAASFADSSEETEHRWARWCAPLLAVRASSEESEAAKAARVATPQVNRDFMLTLPDMDLRAGLANVSCPVLVIAGERDPLVPPSNASEVTTAIPAGLATTYLVSRAGHDVLWDRPDIVEQVIRPFLERCSGFHRQQ